MYKKSQQSIQKDINWLTNRSTSFGYISNITLNDKPLPKNETKNGTFFQIPLYSPFTKYGGDLHLSVFEDSGIITKHVAFKTTIGKNIDFYYGKKHTKKMVN
jgi:hypothetical protein